MGGLYQLAVGVKNQTVTNNVSAMVFAIVAILAKQLQVVPIQSDIRIVDVVRRDVYLVVDNVPRPAASLA